MQHNASVRKGKDTRSPRYNVVASRKIRTGLVFVGIGHVVVTFLGFEGSSCPWRKRLARQSILSQISRGERSFIVAMLGTSILGAMLACVAVIHLSERPAQTDASVAITYWTIFAGCIGGAVGFWVSYERWFGYAGIAGWMSALIGALVVSGIGSVIAGTLILPLYGTMFGPLQLIMMIIAYPSLGAIWLGMLLCAHGLLGQWRHERDSIFQSGYYSAH